MNERFHSNRTVEVERLYHAAGLDLTVSLLDRVTCLHHKRLADTKGQEMRQRLRKLADSKQVVVVQPSVATIRTTSVLFMEQSH